MFARKCYLKKIRATWLGAQTLAAEKRKSGIPGGWRAQIASVSQIHRSLGGAGLFTHRKKPGHQGAEDHSGRTTIPRTWSVAILRNIAGIGDQRGLK